MVDHGTSMEIFGNGKIKCSVLVGLHSQRVYVPFQIIGT
jgi:hypothetical protein